MRKTFFALLLLATFAAHSSLLTLSLTNSLGLPDTNAIKVVQADTNTPTLANGQPVTIGSPARVQPDTNGTVQIFRMVGNYILYGPTLGQGLLYRFPDSSSNATAYPLPAFNTFYSVTLVVNTNASGTNSGSGIPLIGGTGFLVANANGTNVGSIDGTIVVTNHSNAELNGLLLDGGNGVTIDSGGNISAVGSYYGNGHNLTSLNPAFISSGTAAINISGNAATATALVGQFASDTITAYDAQSNLLFGVNGTNVSGGVITVGNNNSVTTFAGTVIGVGTPAGVVTNGISLEQFGGVADGVRLTDIQFTSGSPIIYSPSAPFSAGSVGKAIVLYGDIINSSSNMVVSVITNFVDASHVMISNAPNSTWTAAINETMVTVGVITNTFAFHAVARVGTDNTAAFQSMLNYIGTNNNVGQHWLVNLAGGVYMFTGPIIHRVGTVAEYSMVHIPAPPTWYGTNWNYAGSNSLFTVELAGQGAYNAPLTAGAAPDIGTEFYFATVPASTNSASQINSFLGSSGPSLGSLFGSTELFCQNLIFRTAVYPKVAAIDTSFGGGILLRDCAVDIDWNIFFFQFNNNGSPTLTSSPINLTYVPDNNHDNPYAVGGIYCGYRLNNCLNLLDDVFIYGYPCGIFASENLSARFIMAWNDGTGLSFSGTSGAWDSLYDCHFSQCPWPITVPPTDYVGTTNTTPCRLEAIGLTYQQNHSVSNNCSIWDPNNLLFGDVGLNTAAGPMPTGLTYHVDDGSSPNQMSRNGLVSPQMSTELGMDAINDGLIQDLPMIPSTVNPASQLVSRDPSHTVWQVISSPTIYTNNSPDGSALFSWYPSGSTGNAITPTSTNWFNSPSNFTVDFLYNSSYSADFVYPLYFPNSFSVIFHTGNGCHWRTYTTNGQVDAQFSMDSITNGQWHDIVCTYSSALTNQSVYVDGVLMASARQIGPIVPLSGSILFGSTGPDAPSLAHLRFWNRILSPLEIQRLASTRGCAASNAFNNVSGSFSGNGGGLTNLNASQLTTGTVPMAQSSTNLVAVRTGFVNATNTVTAAGFVSTATNTTYSFTGTGFTNGAGDLILKGVTGVNVTFTNRTSGYGVSYGTITTPTDMFLTQSNVVNAASAFNIIGFQTH